jgi:membrane-bound ClpP family serine protease
VAANGSGFADQVKALVPLARKVDTARKRLAALPEEPDPKNVVAEAVRRYTAVQSDENLEALSEAVRNAQNGSKGQARREKLTDAVAEAEREFKTGLAQLARRAAA